ncbi:hypothetical protein [uncultured Ruminococcus sp.]|uniref:hypothetical protein n=1 Tax=uncultured Ruminococcus sp. TaxID=165186 RepID=UPI0025D42A3E|nr:hypothetical protein [uncultured Ruminococcus sp.]
MTISSSDTSKEFNIMLDSAWTAHMQLTDTDDFGRPSFDPPICSEETTKDILELAAKTKRDKN